jgi:hypothetical protein
VGELRNELAWSFSRHCCLLACARRYHYQHYASWGGWERAAAPEVRETYRLKQLTTRPAWKGQVLHAAIADLLARLRAGRPLPEADDFVASVLGRMRQDYRDSREDRARKTGRLKQHVRFFEHEEDPDDSAPGRRQRWKETAEEVELGLRQVMGSRLLARLAALPPADWIEIEEPAGPPRSFELEGVRVWVKVDLAVRDAGRPLVIDWKTGRTRSPLTPVQLATYALHVAGVLGCHPAEVVAREINVVTGDTVEHAVDEEALATFREVFRESVERMRSYLADVAGNVPKPAAEFPFTEDERECRQCSFRSICPKVSPAY